MRKIASLMCVSLLGAAPPPSTKLPPGEGVLCAMAFVDVAAEAGRRCFAGQNPEFQARIESAEAKFDTYFLKNGPATADELAKFKHLQAGVGNPNFDCKDDDLVSVYKKFSTLEPEVLTREVDDLLSKSGKPTFGDCT